MRAALLGNGAGRLAFNPNLEYNYKIGCNIPWADVNSTVITDSNIIEAWCKNPDLIKVPVSFTTRAWRAAGEYHFRDHIERNKLFLDMIGDFPEFYNSGHMAAIILCNAGYSEIDVYGCNSIFERTVESYTNKFVNDFNPDSENQRIENWRRIWGKIEADRPQVKFNFIPP